MRYFLLLVFHVTLLFGKLEISGHVDIDSQLYLTKSDSKNGSNFTASQTFEFEYEKDDYSVYATLYTQEDYSDLLKENEKTQRTFMRIDELYLEYSFEDDSIIIGKNIKFWGSLEFENIVDVFNPSDLRADILSTDKLGIWNLSYSHFTQNGEFSMIIKLYEQDQKMANQPYAYYFLPSQLTYDKNLQTSNGVYRPSIYLMYSASLDSEYPLDFAFIFENGYDSQRYISSSVSQPTTLYQNAYLVNKFITFNTLVIGTTLIKLELLYADVIKDKKVSDYSHIGFGVEHTIENVFEDIYLPWSKANLGLIAEYYKYNTYESEKMDDLKLYESMQNDLFIGVRYTFNNADDSSIVGGIVIDMEYGEEIYFIEYESRFGDSFKMELDYNYINPSSKELTTYASLGKHQRVGLSIAYYF
ncbi:MAG: hypothetical protein L3J10_04385 [Sulfurimonas sp.]|nr:hypothetical protein [Sulfurimonas sp.]